MQMKLPLNLHLWKLLAFLCAAGLLLVVGLLEIGQMLNISGFHSTITNYLVHGSATFCKDNSSISEPHSPVIKAPIIVNTTDRCNCSQTAHSPCPVQVVVKKTSLLKEKQWHADKFWHEASTFPLCTMDTCFNFSRCADMSNLQIYAYGNPYKPIRYLMALNSSGWITTDPNQACLFLITAPQQYAKETLPHPSTLPYWNGGVNHIIATFADKWSVSAPPPHTIGNASVVASCLKETTYRAGFDISIPLPGKTHLTHLQRLKPWSRRYFLTFRGTRYLGQTAGNFRSDPALRAMHNGEDVIIAFTCNQVTNNKIRAENPEEGKGCDEDDGNFKRYTFKGLMNTTFGLAPAGRSPSSYRMIETLSAGAIPVLIADNYVKPFDTIIQWHQCALQFPTSEIARILPALRAMLREEVERRQRYCLFIYTEYFKDDDTLARSVVRSLKLRFYGVLPQFNEAIRTGTRRRR